MGTIISARKFSRDDVFGLLKPIVYCCPYEEVTDRAVPINRLLAERLVGCKANRRTMHVESFFCQILSQFPNDVVIKDFDVLFNPDYKVDVLKMLVNTCKVKPFSVIWPGTFEGTKLIYAEEGFQDYKTYDVNDYDITCII